MPNSKGWYTKEEVLESGLPYYIPRSKRWTHEPYPFAVLLTRTRCKELGMPALRNGNVLRRIGDAISGDYWICSRCGYIFYHV